MRHRPSETWLSSYCQHPCPSFFLRLDFDPENLALQESKRPQPVSIGACSTLRPSGVLNSHFCVIHLHTGSPSRISQSFVSHSIPFSIPDFKPYIRAMALVQKQKSRMEDPCRRLCSYSYMIFDRDAKISSGRKTTFLIDGVRKVGFHHVEK